MQAFLIASDHGHTHPVTFVTGGDPRCWHGESVEYTGLAQSYLRLDRPVSRGP